MNDLQKQVDEIIESVSALTPFLKLPEKEQKILELEDQMQAADFWSDQSKAQHITQAYNQLKEFYSFWSTFEEKARSIRDLIVQNTDESSETTSYLESQVADLEHQYHAHRIVALLSRKYDDHDAIFSLHAGAGGTDAQDWVAMLLRMYLRFCEQKGFTTEILEESKGADAGIKSVTVQVRGPYAFGYLKSEAGVHRLVRLSPFNPAHTRETSFALLELLPILEEQEHIALDPKDLKIEANTSSGHGGQSVNTTYSAIRVTHIPTGIRVSIQNERSQHQNKEIALQILAAKLQALEEEKLAKEKKELRGEFKSAEWGNQIRSYVLHPYKLVKDHRTSMETSDTEAVLNGDLDAFVEKYLETQVT